jgi:hypothetical protein
MENRPKRSLSLRKQGQKRLTFTSTAVQGQGADLSSAPQTGPEEEASSAVPASSSTSWLSGLCNLGNSCYANSILQVLRFCPLFSAKVKLLSELLLNQRAGVTGDEQDGSVESGMEDWQNSKGALVIHLHKVSKPFTHFSLHAELEVVLRAQTPYREKGSGRQPMNELSQRNAIAALISVGI